MVVQPPAPPVAPVEENVPEIPSHQPETVNSSPFDDMDVDNDNQNDDHPMDRDDQSEHSDEGDESENDGVAGLTIGSTIAPSSPSRSPSREERAAIMARIILSRQQQSEPSQPADPTPGPSATSPSAENRTGDVRSAMLAAATSRQQSALTSSPQTLSASTKTKTRTMLRSLRDVCLRVCASIVFNPATPRAAVSRLPHLGSHLTEQLMQALMSTRQLERMSLLRLSTCTIERVVWDAYVLATDSLLQTLATSQWKNVRKLSLKACSFVTDAGVGECVESLKYLEILDLSGCRLTDLVAFPISSITKLEYLNLSGTKVTAAGVGIIGSSQTIAASLCELYLSQCEHISGDRVLAALAPLRNLQILQLSSTKLTSPQRLPPRTQDDSLFPSLRRLDLSRTQLRDEDLSRTLGPKLHGEQLEELDLRGCNLCGMEGVSAVVTGKFSSLNCIVFPNKEHLDIDGVLARMAGAECADGEKLKMVRMELEGFAMLTDAGLEWMRVVGFESLSFLSLGGTKIGDAGLRAVGGTVFLQRRVSFAHLMFIACTELRELYLDRTAVTDEGMAFLKGTLCVFNHVSDKRSLFIQL
ncbi:hypothetical protein BJ742DRAFT_361871 [Cladochytrium replicatum]|nr:hypothetical protein BJ742DRAFT_361871 [Cladochytrium replicatum]